MQQNVNKKNKQRNRDQDEHFDTGMVYVVQIMRDP